MGDIRRTSGLALLAMVFIIMMEIWAKIKHPAVAYSPMLIFWEVAACVLFFVVWRGIWPPSDQ